MRFPLESALNGFAAAAGMKKARRQIRLSGFIPAWLRGGLCQSCATPLFSKEKTLFLSKECARNIHCAGAGISRSGQVTISAFKTFNSAARWIMRTRTFLGIGVATVASALTLQAYPAWADGPEAAYGAEEEVPSGSLSANEYQLNADGMKEDSKAKMSDVARAYRNGYINRGKQDQADYQAMIDSRNHGQRQPAKTDVARVDVPPLPPGVPEDDNSKYTSIPPQPRQYAQRHAPQAQPQPQPQTQPQQQYQQAYQQPQYAPPAMPMQYQQAPVYTQMQPQIQPQMQPVYADTQPLYVRPDYAPAPVQYVPVYSQAQYEEAQIVETVMQPVAPVAYQVYRPPVYWAQPHMYAYRPPVVGYRVWR
jgi:hypothetical protein